MSYDISHTSGLGMVFDLDDPKHLALLSTILGTDDIEEYMDGESYREYCGMETEYHTNLPRYSSTEYGEVTNIFIIKPNKTYSVNFGTAELTSREDAVNHFKEQLGDSWSSDGLSQLIVFYDIYFEG